MALFRLSFKNLMSKPLRAVLTVLAIAVATAMIFAMMSFKPTVYDYIYKTQTSISGDSDILISTNSSSARVTQVAAPLKNLEGVERINASLSLYALLGDEYVAVRGLESGHMDELQPINLVKGGYSLLNSGVNPDNVIISENTAEKFSLDVGDLVRLSLGKNETSFVVEGIAKAEGYFANDAPCLFLGDMRRVSKLIVSTIEFVNPACNEIYVKAASGANVDELIEKISSLPAYSSMLVGRAGDDGYIGEQANSLSAPVVLAGAAVFALSIALIVLLFMMSAGEKISLISKYSVIGATKGQVFAIFMLESILLAFVGALIGSALAVGVFVGIVKLTLSAAAPLAVSALRLFGAAAIGFVCSVLSAAFPIVKSFKGTVRQNQLSLPDKSKVMRVLCPVLIFLTIISVIIEFTVQSATAVMSVFSLVLLLATLGVCIGPLIKYVAKFAAKHGAPTQRVSAVSLSRDNRFSRAATMLGVGMTVSMLLFMSWQMTTTVFDDYVSSFDNMIFVTNVRADVDVSAFESVEGVDGAIKAVWGKGELGGDKFSKTMNILGSENFLDVVDFGYISPKDEAVRALDSDGFVLVDIALEKLYGVKVGDKLSLTISGETKEITVGGILEHKLFSGNYIVMSNSTAVNLFGAAPDTVIVSASGDIQNAVGKLRETFAGNNYYAVDVLTAYKWDMQSTSSVFDLIGTLAIVIFVFITVVTVAATVVGRSSSQKDRVALLNAGMSKNALLGSEVLQHTAVAITAFLMSFAFSVLLTACLIHALRLFGLYFTFMYNAWVVAAVGAAQAAAYILVPVAFNFKKGYNIQKR